MRFPMIYETGIVAITSLILTLGSFNAIPVQAEETIIDEDSGVEGESIPTENSARGSFEETETNIDGNDDKEAFILDEKEGISVKENKAAQLANAIDTGSCGMNASWTITGADNDLLLTISGSGTTYDYSESTLPWAAKRSKIKQVIVNTGITSIGDYFFYSLNKMTDVSLPDTLTVIGYSAFSHCVCLEHITLPDSLERIGYHAFSDCTKLKDIVIPNNVTTINTGAFSNCTSLEAVTIPEAVTTIECALLFGCKNLKSVSIPNGVTTIESEAFAECVSLSTIELPDSVTEIGVGAFHVCKSLTDIVVPNSVAIIEGYTFHLCDNLKTIVLPEGMTRIDEYAFASCTNLKSIEISDGTTKIGNSAFEGCTGLTDITIPDSVTSIEYWAFRGCGSLKRITIPDSVAHIGDYAFGYEDTDISIRFRGTKEQWRAAVGNGDVPYKSIVYNCFSVPADFSIEGNSWYTYTGKAIKPSVTVTYKGRKLVEEIDYSIEWKNNIVPGIATINISGIGNYSGTDPVLFNILPGATKKVICTNVASGMKVSWEKVTGATRYKCELPRKLTLDEPCLTLFGEKP